MAQNGHYFSNQNYRNYIKNGIQCGYHWGCLPEGSKDQKLKTRFARCVDSEMLSPHQSCAPGRLLRATQRRSSLVPAPDGTKTPKKKRPLRSLNFGVSALFYEFYVVLRCGCKTKVNHGVSTVSNENKTGRKPRAAHVPCELASVNVKNKSHV